MSRLLIFLVIGCCVLGAVADDKNSTNTSFCEFAKGLGMGFNGEKCSEAGAVWCVPGNWFSQCWNWITKAWSGCDLVGQIWGFIAHFMAVIHDLPSRWWLLGKIISKFILNLF
jgi:hypothetical protein